MDAVRAEMETAVRDRFAPRMERELWSAEWDLRHAYDIAIEEETREAIQEAAETIEEEARVRKEPHLVDEIEQAVSSVRAKYDELIQQEIAKRMEKRATRRR